MRASQTPTRRCCSRDWSPGPAGVSPRRAPPGRCTACDPRPPARTAAPRTTGNPGTARRRSGPRPRSRPASGLGGPAPGAALTSLARRWPVPGRAPRPSSEAARGWPRSCATQPQSALEEVADLAEAPADAGLLLNDGPRLLGRADRVLQKVLLQRVLVLGQGAVGVMPPDVGGPRTTDAKLQRKNGPPGSVLGASRETPRRR